MAESQGDESNSSGEYEDAEAYPKVPVTNRESTLQSLATPSAEEEYPA
eukprot:CAMPEP_0118934158 /NCGR_PEP_ID=MMETSP1169-20130426/13670_1 /TAXON_ID=36882 /ORGANISM="Pyramimonas obovata, Strain CCMP722" /LENGTH=47 /DNA_ID= /DNA_START= /DNA_END= /DNA_ORIENTATION=